ncbi:MAG: TolC family protein [Lysobacterales bacterium]
MTRPHWRHITMVLMLAALAGCVSPSRQEGRLAVDQLTASRLPATAAPESADAASLTTRVAELGQGELSLDRALQLALINNPRLQAEYAQLGLARADLIEASRLSNPRFALLRKDERGGDGRGYTRHLSQSFTELLLLPASTRMAKAEFARTQQQIGAAVLDLAVDVEVAWYRAVAALQTQAMREAIAKAAQLSAELAQRFHAAGNLPRLELLMEQAAATQASIEARRAGADVAEARAELAALLGLRSRAPWTVPARLPGPTARTLDADTLVRLARGQRLDYAASQAELAMREDALKLARNWRWFGDIELGIERETETDGARFRGLEVSLELPIFQQGQAAIARAEAERDAAAARLSELELAIDNQLVLALERLQMQSDVAEQYQAGLLPQREGIVDGTQRELNFMFKGAFELLLVKQEQYAAYQDYLEAVRDYWVARAELRRAVGGRLPDDGDTGEVSIGVDAILPDTEETPDDRHQHHHH